MLDRPFKNGETLVISVTINLFKDIIYEHKIDLAIRHSAMLRSNHSGFRLVHRRLRRLELDNSITDQGGTIDTTGAPSSITLTSSNDFGMTIPVAPLPI